MLGCDTEFFQNKKEAIEKPGQMDFLASIVKKADKEFFSGVAGAVEFLRNIKIHAEPGNKS